MDSCRILQLPMQRSRGKLYIRQKSTTIPHEQLLNVARLQIVSSHPDLTARPDEEKRRRKIGLRRARSVVGYLEVCFPTRTSVDRALSRHCRPKCRAFSLR